jgi:predicted ribosome quality control (RQC) complex YloA/Tae2 family protein
VAELARELEPLLVGRTLESCVALVPRDLLLVFAAPPDGSLRLRLSADPDLPRFHLQCARQARPQGPIGPFFRRVEQELAGTRLRSLAQLARDRVLGLVFEGGPDGARTLVLELFGRRANLVLCGKGERVLDVLVPAGPKAQPRLALGEPWQAPGGAQRGAEGGTGLAAALADFAPQAETPGQGDPRAPLSWLVEARLGPALHVVERERDARELRSRLERKRAKAEGLLRGLERRAVASAGALRVQLDGELLKLNLPHLRRGLERIELEDVFGDGGARILDLDPRRSPSENVELYFERYKKLARAEESVALELERARAKLAELAGLLERLDDPAQDPSALENEALEQGLLDPRQEADVRKRKAPEERKPYRSFTALRGSEVRVGRTARDNDELTLHHARGNDLWLHTADAPGSHVILRLERGAEPDPEELLDAAHLAVHFSPLRESVRVNVHVARRKAVHKPRGAKPGLVTLSGGRILVVRMQPERTARLLQRDRSLPPPAEP